ncbi:MAG: tripartite tricarboxylate transporter substrate-binding protein [Proteobacteria bacterium]|nr:tripartite tricarboxylate transporter substrate-binding protein [Pseudomonadota bacterium]
MRFVLVLALAFTLAAGSALAHYPNRPIKLIVPFPPAGATDIVDRIVAQKLTERLGQSVVVENKPGAGGSIGSDIVAKSAPDGFTLLMATSSTHSIGSSLQKLPYDPIKDFAAIIHVANVPNALAVNAPAGTPAAIVARVQSEVVASLAAPDLRERFSQVGAEAVGSTPQQFTDRILADTAKWAKLIKAANVKLQ